MSSRSSQHTDVARPVDTAVTRTRALPVLFAISLFMSAFLLFSVQPMISRMVLPRLGGSPSVWNTCVCFFQAALLLGYLYADWSANRLSARTQLGLHAAVLAAAMVLLPLSIGTATPPTGASPALWLLVRLSVTVGPLFIAIAATAPLLQSWFARTDHRTSGDPYFLYAASNTGSLLALLSYPLAIDTTLGLTDQARVWSAGFVVTAVAVLGTGAAALWRAPPAATAARWQADIPSLPAATQVRWIGLAFVPSALMLAVTTYITTDIASAPLFWVLPLAVYILTFVVAFRPRRAASSRTTSRRLLAAQAAALAAAGVAVLEGIPNLVSLAIALAAFTLTAAVCHTELAARRPPTCHLTRYFLLISIGGALGGVFNALAAPLLFRGPWEYPLLLIAACLLRPPPASRGSPRRDGWAMRGDPVLGLLLPVGALALLVFARSGIASAAAWGWAAAAVAILLPFAGLLWFSARRARLAFALSGLFVLPAIVNGSSTLASSRSFFGIYRIREVPGEHLVSLQNGTTVHGVQSTLPGETTLPLGYYSLAGPFGRLFAARRTLSPAIRSVGVVGLGNGSLSCYAQTGESWTFREIDPAVEQIARDNRYFHFLTECGHSATVVLGDARITLAADTARYDLLIIDAFSSDSIPLHLLTREALALYFARLNPGGMVAFHLSNRYLDLAPVVARLAQDCGAQARRLRYVPDGRPDMRHTPTEAVVIAPPGVSLAFLTNDGWDVPIPGPVLWTDERADLLRVIR